MSRARELRALAAWAVEHPALATTDVFDDTLAVAEFALEKLKVRQGDAGRTRGQRADDRDKLRQLAKLARRLNQACAALALAPESDYARSLYKKSLSQLYAVAHEVIAQPRREGKHRAA